jgi:hypothetical protein
MKSSFAAQTRERFAYLASAALALFATPLRADSLDARIVQAESRIAELTSLAAGLLEGANQEGKRELKDDERTQLTAYMDEAERLRAEVTQTQRVLASMSALGESRGRQTSPNSSDPALGTVVARVDTGDQPPARSPRADTHVQTQ